MKCYFVHPFIIYLIPMAKISDCLGELVCGKDSIEGPWNKRQTYDDLIWEGWRKSCLITCENEPQRWGFFNDDWWGFVISSNAVNISDYWVSQGYRNIWIAIGDAMLDAWIDNRLIPSIIKALLATIELGIMSATSQKK